jgi:hypothetical protein
VRRAASNAVSFGSRFLEVPTEPSSDVDLDIRSHCIQRLLMAASEEFAIVSARISPETQEKLERYLHYLNDRDPGLNVKTSTAVRMLIVRGLEQAEKEVGTLPALSRGKR